MPGRIYITLAEGKEFHRALIEEFGGTLGLRDEGRLEAALFRPQTGYYSTLAEEAAALMESLANNHPFLDGNKRMSFAVTDTFLRLNGYYLDVEARAAYEFIVQALSKSDFALMRSATGSPRTLNPSEKACRGGAARPALVNQNLGRMTTGSPGTKCFALASICSHRRRRMLVSNWNPWSLFFMVDYFSRAYFVEVLSSVIWGYTTFLRFMVGIRRRIRTTD